MDDTNSAAAAATDTTQAATAVADTASQAAPASADAAPAQPDSAPAAAADATTQAAAPAPAAPVAAETHVDALQPIEAALHVGTLKSMADHVIVHIDGAEAASDESTYLHNARAAIRSAIQYVELHWEAVAAKAKAELAKVEAELDKPLDSASGAATTATAATAG